MRRFTDVPLPEAILESELSVEELSSIVLRRLLLAVVSMFFTLLFYLVELRFFGDTLELIFFDFKPHQSALVCLLLVSSCCLRFYYLYFPARAKLYISTIATKKTYNYFL